MGTLHEFVLHGDRRPPAAPPPERCTAHETLSPETTIDLLSRVKAGDGEAVELLLARCLPPLRRWAHGRLPPCARDLQDTADLVQDTIVSALKRLDRFEPRHEGALQSYLREALVNRIRDIMRKKIRRPMRVELRDDLAANEISPLEEMLGREKMARYDAALGRLRAADRDAIVARLELQYSYDDLAMALGKPSANAARVAVCRAIRRLADEMRHGS